MRNERRIQLIPNWLIGFIESLIGITYLCSIDRRSVNSVQSTNSLVDRINCRSNHGRFTRHGWPNPSLCSQKSEWFRYLILEQLRVRFRRLIYWCILKLWSIRNKSVDNVFPNFLNVECKLILIDGIFSVNVPCRCRKQTLKESGEKLKTDKAMSLKLNKMSWMEMSGRLKGTENQPQA